MALVYMATNKVNGKRYVGATSNTLKYRSDRHVWAAKSKKEVYPLFHRAIRKYGKDAFEWITLSEHSTFDEALEQEVRTIHDIKPEYNIHIGGNRGAYGLKLSQEVKDKIAKAHIGIGWTVEGREKILTHMRSPERRAAMRSAAEKMWTTRRDELIQKHRIGYAKGGFKRPVICIDDSRVFKNATEAAQYYDCNSNAITQVCAGKFYRTGGRIFRLFVRPISEDERNAIIAEVKELQAASRRHGPRSPEHREKISKALRGRKVPEEICVKLRGQKRSKEFCEKMRALGLRDKEKWLERAKAGPAAMARAVVCIDDGRKYKSATEAADFYGVAKSALIELCLGQRGRKTVGGKRFSYVEKERLNGTR